MSSALSKPASQPQLCKLPRVLSGSVNSVCTEMGKEVKLESTADYQKSTGCEADNSSKRRVRLHRLPCTVKGGGIHLRLVTSVREGALAGGSGGVTKVQAWDGKIKVMPATETYP